MKKFYTVFVFVFILLAFATVPAFAQDDQLTISLSRDFGYGGGGEIQGLFSIRASGPEGLVRVAFFIDGEKIGEDSEAPFSYQFSTDSFPLGSHSISAVGYTQDGQELLSNKVQREFVSAEAGWKAALKIIGPVFALVIGISLLAFVVPMISGRGKSTPLGAPRNYGLTGGTICPKCKRPFALNFFKLNLVVGALDRCPHCGKFSIIRRHSLEALRLAEAAELQGGKPQVNGMSEEEKLKKELENSRYQDM